MYIDYFYILCQFVIFLLFDDYVGIDKNNMMLKEEVIIYGEKYIDG